MTKKSAPQGGGCLGFGCGVFVGLLLAGIAIPLHRSSPIVFVIGALACGIAGAVYGDRFFNSIGRP